MFQRLRLLIFHPLVRLFQTLKSGLEKAFKIILVYPKEPLGLISVKFIFKPQPYD